MMQIRWYARLVLIVALVACSGPAPGGPSEAPLAYEVDPQVVPLVMQIPGLFEGDPPRPVGAVQAPDGAQMDFVLGEVIVVAASLAEIQPFLDRRGGTVVDTFDPADVGGSGQAKEFLVRVEPEGFDVSTHAGDALALEPGRTGRQRVSSRAAVELLAMTAREAAAFDVDVLVNVVAYADVFPPFPSSATSEAPIDPDDPSVGNWNALDYSYMQRCSVQEIGVDAAWRLLSERGFTPPSRLEDTIPIMIADGGFVPNDDFPAMMKIRRAQWGDPNSMMCGSAACPWHGTVVTLTAMGTSDNGYGVAGPAAPVARLIALDQPPDSWTSVNRLREMVASERPKIVNMSYSYRFTENVGRQWRRHEEHYGAVRDAGVLMFAAAGNQGLDVDGSTLVLPCQSSSVVCVGGLENRSTFRHINSNHGGDPDAWIRRSVELYAPYIVWSIADPSDPERNAVRAVAGTSVASPFAAGVAALVWYADPSLSADEVREWLHDTAHVGVGGVAGHQRRLDAFGAVAAVLGVPSWHAPSIDVRASASSGSPTHGFPPNTEIWFEADTRDDCGDSVPLVEWTIGTQVSVTEPSSDGLHHLIVDSLPVGSHLVRARALDKRGYGGVASLTVNVRRPPPEPIIIKPDLLRANWAGQDLVLAGTVLVNGTPAPDHQGRWRVVRGGVVIHDASGHATVVPATSVDVGAYRLEFIGTDLVETVTRHMLIDVSPKPPEFPTAVITAPPFGSRHPMTWDQSVLAARVAFAGRGTDQEDGELAGSRLRWTATYLRDGALVSEILCSGSAYGGNQDCRNFEALLVVHQTPQQDGDGLTFETRYSITLDVRDSDGNDAHADTTIVVYRLPEP